LPSGNIVKGDKNDVKKLKDDRTDIVNAIYDNREVINANIKHCKKNQQSQSSTNK
jgi:hypothetical protein